MRRQIAGVSALALAVGLGFGAPAWADEFRTISRDGIIMQFQRVAKAGTPMTGSGATRSDFDGDGIDDTAVTGDPGDYNLPHYPTGVVVVRYSSAPQVDYFMGVLDDGGGCVCFGTALEAGDFNGDGYHDLVIGDSDEVDPANRAHAGGVWIIPGSAAGLLPDSASHVNQSSSGVPGEPENHDRFGSALAAGDVNGDGRDDLAIGAFGEAIGSKSTAGAVTVIFGGPSGLTGAGAQDLYQDQAAVPGASESNDQFGFTLAIGEVNGDGYADLAIGSPRENDGSGDDGSGTVILMRGAASGVSTTGATSVTGWGIYPATGDPSTIAWYLGDALVIGDVNGDGLGEVVAGAPGAQTPQLNGGLIAVFTGRAAGLANGSVRVINQRTSGIPGEPETDDRFGGTLAAGDVTGDGRADVLVGAPGEAIGSAAGAGVVTLLKGSAAGLTGTGAQSFDQNHAGIPGGAESGDTFGASVALLNLDGTGGLDALVSASGEEVGGDTPGYPSGATYLLHGSTGGLVPQNVSTNGLDLRTDRVWPRRYGMAIAGG